MIVLGVDVGIRACGYVVCEVRNLDVKLLNEGQIQPDASRQLPEKLNHIYSRLEAEIVRFKPKAAVVEKLYSHHKHPTTLGVLAQVRGVVALLAHKKNLQFFEYSPTRARKSFLGRGRGNSEQVKKMAENVTNRKFMSLHTADAYSLVVAFSHTQKVKNLMPGFLENSKQRFKNKNIVLNNALSNSRKTGKERRTSSYS
jgi:crossover junction endodeoxyribonuclease RuvC